MKELGQFPDKKRPEIDAEKVTRFIKDAQELGREAEIAQKEGTWIPQTEWKTPFAVTILSDIHYGSNGTDYDLFDRHLEIARNTPNMFLATNGDHVDNFSPTVLPSGMLDNSIPPGLQTRAFVNIMQPLDDQGKIAWMNIGNHDDWVGAAGYSHEDSLANIQAPILDRMGIIHIPTRGGAKYRGAVAHQHWGASKLNITNSPKRLIEHHAGGDADFGITGHTHQSSYEQFEKGGRSYTAIVAGAYKQHDKWARGKGIGGNPSNPGVTMVFWQDRKKIQVFADPEDARDFILGQAAMEGGVINPKAMELYKVARKENRGTRNT